MAKQEIVSALNDIKAALCEINALLQSWGKTMEVTEQDITKCPQCGGPADNGFSREIPPAPYVCSDCMLRD